MRTIKNTPAQVRALVSKAAKANASALVTAKQARVLSATATWAAVESGHLGGPSPIWPDVVTFIGDLGLTNAKGEPASPSTVTGLTKLGRALAVGLDPVKEEQRWNALSHKAGTKEMTEVLGPKVEKVTIAQVRKLADSFIRDAAETKKSGPTKTAAEKAAEKKAAEDKETVDNSTPAERIAVAIKVLSTEFKSEDVDDETFGKFAEAIERVLTRERTLRAKRQTDEKAA